MSIVEEFRRPLNLAEFNREKNKNDDNSDLRESESEMRRKVLERVSEIYPDLEQDVTFALWTDGDYEQTRDLIYRQITEDYLEEFESGEEVNESNVMELLEYWERDASEWKDLRLGFDSYLTDRLNAEDYKEAHENLDDGEYWRVRQILRD